MYTWIVAFLGIVQVAQVPFGVVVEERDVTCKLRQRIVSKSLGVTSENSDTYVCSVGRLF